MNEEAFVKALAKLKPEAAQRLWKKFQNSRKAEGAEDEYQETLKGKSAGSLHKKRKLLLGWIQSGKTCGEIYREYMTKVTFTKTSGEKEKWLTITQALQCWGKNELWQRVKSGTIKARGNPEDNRFWEFRINKQVGKTEVARAKASSVTFSGKADQKVGLEFDRQDWTGLLEDDWDVKGLEEEGKEDGEEEKDLAKLLGVKLPNKDNKDDEWELASKIPDADTQDEISDKVMKFKTELEKDKSILDLKEHECKKKKIQAGNLFKEKKNCSRKWRLLAFAFFVLQVELDSPMPPIGLESPSHSIRQPTCFLCFHATLQCRWLWERCWPC